jgi:transcriptional regulator with PAS, ATPase and Fis domain
MLPAVAHSDATVLLEGPSGSGKGLLASTIHGLSPRSKRPLVKVSCAALPEALLESELFGYKRGAFTDAKQDKVGRIALAEGGTLFLDEIGDVPPSIQVKLLRVLQEREYEPLGATRTSKADVRVIAATNRKLGELIRADKFREDLYYRLAVVRIALPSLAERREDIPHLVERFVARFSARTGKAIGAVSAAAMGALQSHGYPGNIRELENAIEHAFVLCSGGMIELAHLPDSIRLASATAPQLGPGAGSPLQVAEAAVIRQAIDRAGGNLTQAAKQLGMHRTTLWRKMRAFGST